MDAQHFDRLAKRMSSRRTALGGLLAGFLLPLEASARGKQKNRRRKRTGNRRDKGKNTKRAALQLESCWRSGACIPRKGSNVSQCDLSGYSTFPTADCTGCNLSRANLSGVGAQNVNFTKANLSGACLVGADFTGATFAKTTNLSGAIFCRTKRPNGDIDDSGCQSGTACCPTPCLSATDCASGERCCEGTCIPQTSCCANSECTSNLCESGTCLVEYALVPYFEDFPEGVPFFVVDDDLRLERNGQIIFEDSDGVAQFIESIPFYAKTGDALRVIGINGPLPNHCAYIDPVTLRRTDNGARQVLDANGLDIGCGQPAGEFYDRTFTIAI